MVKSEALLVDSVTHDRQYTTLCCKDNERPPSGIPIDIYSLTIIVGWEELQ